MYRSAQWGGTLVPRVRFHEGWGRVPHSWSGRRRGFLSAQRVQEVGERSVDRQLDPSMCAWRQYVDVGGESYRKPSPRALANSALTEQIRVIHERRRCTYGAPRIHADPACSQKSTSPANASLARLAPSSRRTMGAAPDAIAAC